jgi:type IV fimbrial biogenesis protein FimT
MRQPRGHTLTELLCALAILAVMLGLGWPELRSVWLARQGEVQIAALQRLLGLARSTALSSGRTVGLCGSSDGRQCSGRWQDGVLGFQDANDDGLPDSEAALLRWHAWQPKPASLSFASFPRRTVLLYGADGATRQQNGSFTWCPVGNDARYAQQLLIAQSGRVRVAVDSDGDGRKNGAGNQPVTCPP